MQPARKHLGKYDDLSFLAQVSVRKREAMVTKTRMVSGMMYIVVSRQHSVSNSGLPLRLEYYIIYLIRVISIEIPVFYQ